jgi:membrane protease subunit (stomatin/prohibitin family)
VVALFDFIKKQFIDVIEWTERDSGVLSYRYPMQDKEIQNGAKLTVRDSQLALFVNEGRIADLFKPGLFTLNTNTLPVLTNLLNWDKLFQSPFKSDVYFFSTREQIDQRWGTQAPITIRDNMFGVVRLRAHGTYSYLIEDPTTFYQKISGTQEIYTVAQIEGQLRSLILTSIASQLGSSQHAFVDMAANQMKFSELLKDYLVKPFSDYGLKLSSFFVQSITLPEELQEYLDKSTSMKMVGDLRQYTQFQAAESLPLAAQNEGGLAGAGVGLGAGISIGQAFTNALGQTNANVSANQGIPSEDPFAVINKLHELLTKGIISQEEFDLKKIELLKKIN